MGARREQSVYRRGAANVSQKTVTISAEQSSQLNGVDFLVSICHYFWVDSGHEVDGRTGFAAKTRA